MNGDEQSANSGFYLQRQKKAMFGNRGIRSSSEILILPILDLDFDNQLEKKEVKRGNFI